MSAFSQIGYLFRSYTAELVPFSNFYAGTPISPMRSRNRESKEVGDWFMRAIAQKRPTGFYMLLSKKSVRLAVLLCNLVLVSAAIHAFIIVLGGKAL